MAWSNPRTYVAGEILTAAILNVDHRDNLLILKTSHDDNGHHIYTTVSKTGTYTIVGTDDVLFCNGTFTTTLPTAVGRNGKAFLVKNTGTGLVTVNTTSSQTIDGALTFPVSAGMAVWFLSDNANYQVF